MSRHPSIRAGRVGRALLALGLLVLVLALAPLARTGRHQPSLNAISIGRYTITSAALHAAEG